jgi:flagellar motor switch protein FliN/FliY
VVFLGASGGLWAIFGVCVADKELERRSIRLNQHVFADATDMTSEPKKSHSRAVLAIKTPVSVTLARKQVSLERIVNLVPGSMLTFDAHCDEPLTLEVGGQPIATGETVKIGDKFGLRIRDILYERDEE